MKKPNLFSQYKGIKIFRSHEKKQKPKVIDHCVSEELGENSVTNNYDIRSNKTVLIIPSY